MADGYVKILCSILDSSIWAEPDDVVRVWVTLLAMADRDGYVGASVGGIAARTRTVSRERVAECLSLFESPDPDSRSDEFDGRRVQRVERGWLILNYRKIRDMHGVESVKASKRNWWNANRGKDSKSKKLESSESSLDDSSSSDETRRKPMDLSLPLSGSSGSETSDARARVATAVPAATPASPRIDRFGAAMAGAGPGTRKDVLELHSAWRTAFGRSGATLRHATGDDAYALAEAIDAHGLPDCLLVAREAPKDGMVNGQLDEKSMKHESIRYIFGNEETFSRILAAAKRRTETPTGAPKKSYAQQRAEHLQKGRLLDG